jgi:hypothetical protein
METNTETKSEIWEVIKVEAFTSARPGESDAEAIARWLMMPQAWLIYARYWPAPDGDGFSECSDLHLAAAKEIEARAARIAGRDAIPIDAAWRKLHHVYPVAYDFHLRVKRAIRQRDRLEVQASATTVTATV